MTHENDWYKAWRDQKSDAKRRGIPFRLPYRDWLDIWAESGKLDQRGVNGYVMCRKDDRVGYERGNVRIAHYTENRDDLWNGGHRAYMAEIMRRRHKENPTLAEHLRDRERHPRGKAVIGPDGTRYASAALAAEAAGITRVGMAYRCRRGIEGWTYEMDEA